MLESGFTVDLTQVCSRWIGSGVARDLNDLRRVHQLLVSSLAKLERGKDSSPLFSESASTMERLAVLRAWAEVYIVAMKQEKERCQKDASQVDEEDEDARSTVSSVGESLLSLVQPEMATLSRHWLAALKDHALLSLPQGEISLYQSSSLTMTTPFADYSSQLPSDGGAFYTYDTMDSSRPHYRRAWPAILYAVSLWLKETGFTSVDKDDSRPANMKADRSDSDRFHLLLGEFFKVIWSSKSWFCIPYRHLC